LWQGEARRSPIEGGQSLAWFLSGPRLAAPEHSLSVYDERVATHIRKNITLPRTLDERLRQAAERRGTSQSGLIVHLVEVGLAAEAAEGDPLLGYLGLINGPEDLSETVDRSVYGA